MLRLIFPLILAFQVLSLQAQPLNVKVQAKSAILFNPKNQTTLYEKRAHEPYYPASIMKIATALFVLDRSEIDLQTKIRASKEALTVVPAEEKQADFFSYPPYVIEHDGVTIGIEEGKEYSIEALLHGALLSSGNDASNVLAEGVGSTIDAFMQQMNRYVQSKGLTHTVFQNPHGLHHPAQMTTAHDMAQIMGYALEHPVFRQIIVTPSYEMEEGLVWENTNRFIKEGQKKYPYYVGGKTGYVASAGYNLVAAMEKEGRLLVAVLLGCTESKARFEDAIHLFEAAFREELQKRLLFSAGQIYPCLGDVERPARLEKDIELLYFPSEETDLEPKLFWSETKASQKGKVVGRLAVINAHGVEIASAPLVAATRWKGAFPWMWLYASPLLLLLLVGFKQFRKIGKR